MAQTENAPTQSLRDMLLYGAGRWIDGEYARRYQPIQPIPFTATPGASWNAAPAGQPSSSAVERIAADPVKVAGVVVLVLAAVWLFRKVA